MLKYDWTEGRQEVWRLEEELDKDTVFADSLKVTSYSGYRAKETFAGTGDFKMGGKIIRFVKYTYGLLLLAKEQPALQWLSNSIIEVARCFGMEMNVEKTEVMKISRQASSRQIMTDQKQLEDVEYFRYFGSMKTRGDLALEEAMNRH